MRARARPNDVGFKRARIHTRGTLAGGDCGSRVGAPVWFAQAFETKRRRFLYRSKDAHLQARMQLRRVMLDEVVIVRRTGQG